MCRWSSAVAYRVRLTERARARRVRSEARREGWVMRRAGRYDREWAREVGRERSYSDRLAQGFEMMRGS